MEGSVLKEGRGVGGKVGEEGKGEREKKGIC